MELGRALSQISEIHGHLARTEIYRGYKPVPLALTGILAFAAAAAEPQVLAGDAGLGFVAYWTAVAFVCMALCAGAIGVDYVRADAFARRGTRRVLGQFVPCIAAGIALSLAVAGGAPHVATLLPGLWCLLFSLGIFASRPYLPRATGWVGLYYLAAGAALLWLNELSLLHWAMGTVFGLGQLGAALVLQLNRERDDAA